MTLPVKSLSEIEVKSEVSENDKILILDSVSEEARLASKDELKGDPGVDGKDGTDGKDGKDGKDGVDGKDGTDGKDGNGITSVTSSKVGKTTTVTMNFDEGDPFSFQVLDGEDGGGSGTGDMKKSVYDPNGIEDDAFDYRNMTNTPNYGASLSLTINSSTYVVTAQLKDQNGNNLGTAQTIDLPLESVVVSGSYDAQTKKVILTLQNGSTIEFSVADLVAGLQSEITSTNKLASDLVDDTNQTNKFVTTTEKSTWSGKQDALTLPATPTQGHLVTWGSDNKTVLDGGAVPTGVPAGGTNGQVLTNVNGTPTWANPTGGIQVSPNSTITGIKYVWYGTESDYANLSQYYTVVPGDTEFHTF